MKWRVNIPKPSAKRLTVRKVTVFCSDGWEAPTSETFDLALDQMEFDFEVEDSRPWIRETTCNDGPVFDVWIESENASGTRKEKKHLVPTKLL